MTNYNVTVPTLVPAIVALGTLRVGSMFVEEVAIGAGTPSIYLVVGPATPAGDVPCFLAADSFTEWQSIDLASNTPVVRLSDVSINAKTEYVS